MKRLLGLWVLLMAASLSGATAQAFAEVTISGQITDHATGGPLAGVSVVAYPDTGQACQACGGHDTTDSNGYYTIVVPQPVQQTQLMAFLSGYYDQTLGGPPGYNQSGYDFHVDQPGQHLTVNAPMYQSDQTYFGPVQPSIAWVHPRSTPQTPVPFSDMYVTVSLGSYVASPSTWPADALTHELLSGRGQILETQTVPFAGGGGAEWSAPQGPTVGCGYLGDLQDVKLNVNPLQLTLAVYLRSRPDEIVSTPVTVEPNPQCWQTKLQVSPYVSRCYAFVGATIADRAPNGASIAGTLTEVINHRRPMHFHEIGPSWSEDSQLMSRLHRGSNTIRISFTPADSQYQTPAPRLVRLYVRKKYKVTGLPGGC